MQEKFVLRIVLFLIQYSFTILVNYLIVSTFKVSFIGIIAFSNSLIGFFTLFIDLGFTSIFYQHNSKKEQDEYFTIFLSIKTIIVICNCAPLFIISFFFNLSTLAFNYLILNIIGFMINQFISPFLLNLDFKLKILKFTLVSFINSFIQNSLLLIIVMNIAYIPNPLILSGLILIISSLINIVTTFIASKGEFHFTKVRKENLLSFIKATKPLILLTVLTSITSNLGSIIIGFSYGEETLAYYYIVNNNMIYYLGLVPIQTFSLLNVIFPKEFEDKQYKKIEEMTHSVEKYSSLLYLLLVFFFLLHGQKLFEIFLPNYMDSLKYLYILIFIPYIRAINMPYSSHLLSSKKQKLYSNYLIIKNIIFLPSIIIFVPIGPFSLGTGPLGLAFLTLIDQIIDLFFYRYFSIKVGISPNYKIIIQLVCAILSFIITYIISTAVLRILIFNDIFYVLVSTLFFVSIFLFLLVISKELDKNDRAIIFSLLKISKYKRSLIDEIKK